MVESWSVPKPSCFSASSTACCLRAFSAAGAAAVAALVWTLISMRARSGAIFVSPVADVTTCGAGVREICRKAWTKDAWKENERWAYPFLNSLRDKKLIDTTPNGN